MELDIISPSDHLSAFIQGLWSVTAPNASAVSKQLYPDGCSGVLFNFSEHIIIGNTALPKGVILLPLKKRKEEITLPAGARLAGIRFHPAIGYGVFGKRICTPTLLSIEDDITYGFYGALDKMQSQQTNLDRMNTLYQWVEQQLDFTHVIPDSLEKALANIKPNTPLRNINQDVPLSLRQLERQFKRRMGITAKYYQRILRVKQSVQFLKNNQELSLADIALQFGFSDQAHMTREFQAIACTSPKKLLQN